MGCSAKRSLPDSLRRKKGKEGKLEEKVEIAKNLKKEGLPIELIAQATGFSIEEIQEL